MKRVQILSGIAVVLVALGVFSFQKNRATQTINVHASSIRVAPFSAELRTFKPDGTVTEIRTTARKSDGTEAQIFAIGNGKFVGRRVTEVNGRMTSFFDSVAGKTTQSAAANETAFRTENLTHPPENCTYPYESYLGTETVAGFAAAKVQRKGEMETISWRAPELNCFQVRARLVFKGQPFLSVEPTYVVRGEPDPALFATKAEYREMRPSELRKAVLKHYGVRDDAAACPACDPKWDEKADASYLSSSGK